MKRSNNEALRWLLGLGLVLANTSEAQARTEWTIKDRSIHDSRPTRFDLVLNVDVITDSRHFGAAAWFVIPILEDGFVDSLNDSFNLELGASIDNYQWSNEYCNFSWIQFTPMGGLRWDFYLTDKWTLLAKVKGGFGLGFLDQRKCGSFPGAIKLPYDESEWDTGFGAYYRFGHTTTLRVDVGNLGISGGLSWAF